MLKISRMVGLAMNNECPLMTKKMVATRLGCSGRTVDRLRDSGRMPAPFKMGGGLRWQGKDIETWIEAGCPDVRSHRPKALR